MYLEIFINIFLGLIIALIIFLLTHTFYIYKGPNSKDIINKINIRNQVIQKRKELYDNFRSKFN